MHARVWAALVMLVALLSPAAAQREYINGTVTRVSDGDTCAVDTEGGEIRIRLFGIDAPESDQPFGEEAGRFLGDELLGEMVTVLAVERDPYGRIVGEVFVSGRSINRELVREGLAWWYQRYAPDDYDIARLAYEASESGVGLWADEQAVAPWDWRRGVRPNPGTEVDTDELLDGALFTTLSGSALVEAVRAHFTPDETFSYRGARELMFTTVDSNDGGVVLVYTGQEFVTAGIPNHTVVNTEHTWPQSKFGHAGGAMKTDIHHLYPVFSKVNSSRGNEAFVEIPDNEVTSWWGGPEKQTTMPPAGERDRFSERGPSGFEPREDHKGNVARAMFYFYTIYGDSSRVDVAWFRQQAGTLQEWHDADPIDDRERERSRRIAEHQGNENPFVLDPSLLDRVAVTLGN